MNNRQFADAVTVLMSDPSAYGRVSTRNLFMIEGVLEVLLGEVRVEICKRKKPRLALVRK